MDARLRQAQAPAQGNRSRSGRDRSRVRSHRGRGYSLILDTNALSAFADGEEGVGAILREQPRAAIPVIVLGEFRYGIAGSRHRGAYEQWLDAHLRDFDLLAITAETTIPYASLRVTLKRLG